MIQYEEALQILKSCAEKNRLSVEIRAIQQALGSTLASDIVSPEDVPCFDNSAMDGFVLCAEETLKASNTNPLRFIVKDVISAGAVEATSIAFSSQKAPEPFSCLEIMTGAPVPKYPEYYDSIVKLEDVRIVRGKPDEIILTTPIKKGQHLRKAGEDIQKGQCLLKAGQTLHSEHLLVLDSLGIQKINVYRRPKIALIATGRELVDVNTRDLEFGKIRNSSASYVIRELQKLGCDANFFGIISDQPKEFEEKLLQIIDSESPDVILSTGAVSMGVYDFVPQSLKALQFNTYFHKVAIRPGKPILFAEKTMQRKNIAYFGLPGNPVSTAVGLRFFMEPYLHFISGQSFPKPSVGVLVHDYKKPKDLRLFLKAYFDIDDTGQSRIQILSAQSSFQVSSMVPANAWAILPEMLDSEGVEGEFKKGSLVQFVLFHRQ